jgi:hypothetical protein
MAKCSECKGKGIVVRDRVASGGHIDGSITTQYYSVEPCDCGCVPRRRRSRDAEPSDVSPDGIEI